MCSQYIANPDVTGVSDAVGTDCHAIYLRGKSKDIMANHRIYKPQSARQIQVRLHPPELALVDRYARENGTVFRGRPSRAAAVRSIVLNVLGGANGTARPKRA
jgi:hypothetical protein